MWDDIKIVVENKNDQFGKEGIYIPTIGKHSLPSQRNRNGLGLINFAASRGLVISSTIFCHKTHKATWEPRDRKTKNQINGILIGMR
jgi:hypothetical protein